MISAQLLGFETAGIPSAAPLISACEATKRDIEMACAGLLVCELPLDTSNMVCRSDSELVPWYGEEYDALIPYMHSKTLFLHRTARDFLVDTEAGQRILACGKFPGALPYWKRIESFLVKKLIMRNSSFCPRGYKNFDRVQQLLRVIYRQRDGCHENTNTMICATRSRLVRFCEKVFNSGHLGSNSIVPAHCFHLEQQNSRPWPIYSLLQMAQAPTLNDEIWCEILRAITTRNLDDDTVSELLVYGCSLHSYECFFRLSAIKRLLALGTSLAWNGPCQLHWFTGKVQGNTTAFKELIRSIWACSLIHDTEETPKELLQLIPLFLSRGCSLREDVYIRFPLENKAAIIVQGPAGSHTTLGTLSFPSIFDDTTLIVAYPAAALLAGAFRVWKLEVPAESYRPSSELILDTPNIYPMPPGGKLDKGLARLVEMVERRLREYRLEGSIEEKVPLEIAQGVFRAAKQLRSEDALAVSRIMRFRERVGIWTPFEEWLEHKELLLWDKEGDDASVSFLLSEDREELFKNR
ncbi:hypothetical protein RB594_002007 [Gaeumannomyces avenae]